MGQIGDTPRGPTLGRALRAARGRESLRELSRRTHISRTSLSRFELDQRIPSREVLTELDAALDQRGALLAHLRFDDWEPLGAGACAHGWTAPADWCGPVWFHVSGRPGRVTIVLRSGSWCRTIELGDLGPEGATFGLADGRPVRAPGDERTISCHTSVPTHVFWATGAAPQHLDAIDVSDGWVPSHDGALLIASGRTIADALERRGRSPVELADWLGVDAEVIENLLIGRGPR